MERYSRHIILSEVGPEGQERISRSKVLVIGAGGLGCPVLQYLAAAGIGTLGIIDFDVVERSNLQRQVLFGTSSLGMNKAVAARERLTDLNPTINIEAYPERLTTNNALNLFEAYDIIVDGSDNFATRYLVNDAAILCSKPVVYGAIYKFEGQVSVFNYDDGPSYRCLFPTPPAAGSVANCSEVGVLGVLPGIIGSMQANEVLKIVLGLGSVLSGKILCYNAKSSETISLSLGKNSEAYQKVLQGRSQFEGRNYEATCDMVINEITAEEAIRIKEVQFIDVRDAHELPRIQIDGCVQIPLDQLDGQLEQLDSQQTLVLFCQSGIRSRKGVQLLEQHGINSYSLLGGAKSLKQQLKMESECDSAKK
ncbi:MAG: HesA/MoeB/ThiF family protein [Bacteroidota bacterium]